MRKNIHFTMERKNNFPVLNLKIKNYRLLVEPLNIRPINIKNVLKATLSSDIIFSGKVTIFDRDSKLYVWNFSTSDDFDYLLRELSYIKRDCFTVTKKEYLDDGSIYYVSDSLRFCRSFSFGFERHRKLPPFSYNFIMKNGYNLNDFILATNLTKEDFIVLDKAFNTLYKSILSTYNTQIKKQNAISFVNKNVEFDGFGNPSLVRISNNGIDAKYIKEGDIISFLSVKDEKTQTFDNYTFDSLKVIKITRDEITFEKDCVSFISKSIKKTRETYKIRNILNIGTQDLTKNLDYSIDEIFNSFVSNFIEKSTKIKEDFKTRDKAYLVKFYRYAIYYEYRMDSICHAYFKDSGLTNSTSTIEKRAKFVDALIRDDLIPRLQEYCKKESD